MNGAFLGISVTALIFAGLIFVIGWLSSRSSRWLRMTGALISGALTIYCLIVVVAIVVENWRAPSPTSASLIVMLVFAVTAVASVYAALRAFRPAPVHDA